MAVGHSAGRMARVAFAHLARRLALVDPELASAHSAGKMALVNPELAFVQAAVRTAGVKAAFGHLAGRMAVADMAFGCEDDRGIGTICILDLQFWFCSSWFTSFVTSSTFVCSSVIAFSIFRAFHTRSFTSLHTSSCIVVASVSKSNSAMSRMTPVASGGTGRQVSLLFFFCFGSASAGVSSALVSTFLRRLLGGRL